MAVNIKQLIYQKVSMNVNPASEMLPRIGRTASFKASKLWDKLDTMTMGIGPDVTKPQIRTVGTASMGNVFTWLR